MNKRIFRKIRVVGDVIMAIDIACHAYRLVKTEIVPRLCKKNKKGAETTEEAGAPQATASAETVNEQG